MEAHNSGATAPDRVDEISVTAALKKPRVLTRETLAGLVVALALIPEAISFSIAGVDPKVGLFSSFIMAITIAFVGGRPAMISVATGAVALAMALVGLMESLMTAKLVDDITDTYSNKTREAWGQGIANLASGMFGGMGGCAMIGQTMINLKVSGARTRISTFLAGVFLLILIVVLGDSVAVMPMAALVAVMVMVSVGTFDWHSIAPSTLKRMPGSETLVMVATIVVVVATDNLAIGVVVGVFVASVLFVRRVARFVSVDRSVSTVDDSETAFYRVSGELFFASSNDLTTLFDYRGDPARVVIDMSQSHVWDASTVAALYAIVTKYKRYGKSVELVGLNDVASDFHARLTGELNHE